MTAPVASVAHPHAEVFARAADFQRLVGEAHRAFLEQQAATHRQFLEMRTRALGMLLGSASTAPAASVAAPAVREPVTEPPPPVVEIAAPPPAPAPVRPAALRAAPKTRGLAPNLAPPKPVGPVLDREALKTHAGGRISEVFGPLFAQQDGYRVQVRMPMEPMLLADRATGIDATPGVLGKGTVWTETDVRWGSWYLHDGRMPAGVMIETGQADLLLVSYMGIDFLNRGERCYRLLGCELTYHRAPPAPGETLDYDIHIDGHANQGDVRLMFFHYDCRANGEPALTVRNGQAGFFTPKELADSAGILWKPESQEIVPADRARLDEAPVGCTRARFSPEALRAFASGDAHACFGRGFERARTHVRTPRIAGGRLLFLDEVTELSPRGGHWGRGYLRAETSVHPDDWFFPGHFLNDPCMPGTLMFEGCLQAMAFYLAAMGVTLERDGWRFEPVTGETYKLLCRGQVTPASRHLVYEVFVEEFSAGPVPTLFADLLCTVDGLGAFHARRVGLRLVPDWPLTSHPRLFPADGLAPPPGQEPASLPQCDPAKPVAVVESGPSAGFRLDYRSLVACAWGRPSDAFGRIYERFDGVRRVPRLPGPPYHFMSRIARVEGPMGEAKAGARVEVEYDVPPDAWYFASNGHRSMPMCVLMEAALQPCGWLASYVGCTLLGDDDLLFRNLDGKGTMHAEVLPTSGTLRTRASLTSVSRSGTMIIVSFEVRCTVDGAPVYSLDTVFGFFPPSAFANQPGLPTSAEQRALFDAPPRDAIDLGARPARLCRGSAKLADPFLLMLDRVTHFDPKGGRHGLGCLRAEKDVDAGAWFFKAHFFQDPVQPGSLGVEAMCQALQLFMLETGLHRGLRAPRFEPIAVERALTWKYRGQVVPENRVIGCTLEVSATGRDERGVYAVADASLWVDGKRIYDAKNLAMRLVEGAPDEPEVETIDPAVDRWVNDHCPTWTVPTLPATWMLHRMMSTAARASGRDAVAVDDFQASRWVTVSAPVKLRAVTTPRGDDAYDVTLEAYREARDARLSRFEAVATAVVTVGEYAPAPDALDALDAPEAPDPYASGVLFHGPAFRLLRSLRMGAAGSSAVVQVTDDAGIVLDAAVHGIPHDAMERWSREVPADRVAYPRRIEDARFYGPAPREGELRVEARFLGWDGAHARTRLQLVKGSRVWCELTLAEVLMPKGPLGVAPPLARMAFLRDRRYVEGVSLARPAGDATELDARDVALSNWLPGTIERAYHVAPGEDLAVVVAVRDHVARATATHPSRVRVETSPPPPPLPVRRGGVDPALDLTPAPPLLTGRGGGGGEVRGAVANMHGSAFSLHEPFNRRPVAVSRDGNTVTVRDDGPVVMDMTTTRDFWRARMNTGPWPGEDLFLGLIERFVRRIHVEDPDAMEAQRGKPLLFLGNHQVGVESLLFGIAVSALNGVATLTLAKEEHRTSWVGRLLELGFSYPGLTSPRVIAYFDRDNPASLPGVLAELAEEMRTVGSNVMIHVEGTRSRSCRERVVKMTGALLDMAIALGVSVVPVRFVGGLPVEPVEERLEFPVNMGRQDLHLGAPISPEELASIPYKPRKERVINAINGLGPGDAPEEPLPGDALLAERVRAWEGATGATHPHAVMLRVLETLPSPSPEIAAVVEGARTGRLALGDSPRERWLAELARRLYGPRGPRVIVG